MADAVFSSFCLMNQVVKFIESLIVKTIIKGSVKYMAKKLTASELNKLSSKFNDKTAVRILDGEFEVSINNTFRDSDIDNVVLNYLTVLQEVQRKEQITDELIKDTVSLLNTFVLREFTDLPIPKKNDITSLIRVTKNLLDNGITNEVLSHIPPAQLARVENRIKEAQKGIGKVMGELALISETKDKHED